MVKSRERKRIVVPITATNVPIGHHSFFSHNLRWLSLLILAVQNSVLILIMRYSRTKPGPRYHPSSLVCLGELCKIVFCVMLEMKSRSCGISKVLRTIWNDMIDKPIHQLRLLIPALLYAIQNNLCFFALGLLSAVNYQLFYQAKILTTAMFSVLLLGKVLNRYHWLALLLLLLGVVLVQIGDIFAANVQDYHKRNSLFGFSILIINSITSGFAGVYFEKITKADLWAASKHSKTGLGSLWIQSIKLGIFGLGFSLVLAVLGPDRAMIHETGFLYGIDRLAMCIIFMQAASGLLVAIVIRYADNLLKAFATSASIVISSIISYGWQSHKPTFELSIGSGLVIYSVYLYAYADTCSNRPDGRFKPKILSS